MTKVREKKIVIAKNTLLKTVGKVLKEQGYTKLSINLISDEAEIDKPFIYRHYKDFDGLLKAYVEKQDYWLKNLQEYTDKPIVDHRAFMKQLVLNQFNDLLSNDELQQFLIWELADKKGFTTQVAIEREVEAEHLYEQCKDLFSKFRIDTNMIYAILISSVYYLVLHKDKSTFGTYDFCEKQDVQEFVKTVEWLVDVLFDKLEIENKLEEVAVKAHKKGISVEDIVEITGLSVNRVHTLTHSY
ncbi:MAG: TetR/AcrR family transcriptional regulator [Bacteroidales bacterium]|jgi:AcrR family transcriptional regulator|nr:TetR/AcrR family transcriptional regulator [Bacteroidales bacterium]